MTVRDEVRATAEAVAQSAQYVRVQTDAIEAYAASLPVDELENPELDAATHYLGEPEATLAYVLTLDAINFGSGYFRKLTTRPGLSGYFTVASSLKDAYEARGPLSAAQLARLTQEDCRVIFGQQNNDDAGVKELMGLFSQALNDLGAYVLEQFGESFQALVNAADGSAEHRVSILKEMPFSQDVGFYKRAQLTAADLSVAHVAQFDDLDRLTIFADNLVPHVLRLDGILTYDADLLERIEREELIPAGTPQEREIRAGALHAV